MQIIAQLLYVLAGAFMRLLVSLISHTDRVGVSGFFPVLHMRPLCGRAPEFFSGERTGMLQMLSRYTGKRIPLSSFLRRNHHQKPNSVIHYTNNHIKI